MLAFSWEINMRQINVTNLVEHCGLDHYAWIVKMLAISWEINMRRINLTNLVEQRNLFW